MSILILLVYIFLTMIPYIFAVKNAAIDLPIEYGFPLLALYSTVYLLGVIVVANILF